MPMVKIVNRNGIWEETSTEYSGEDLYKGFELLAPKDLRVFVTEYIEEAVQNAKSTLQRAGFPIEDGIYGFDANGKCFLLGSRDSEAAKNFRGKRLEWPYFLHPKELTIEAFAVEVIQYGRDYLNSINSGVDKWQQATKSIIFERALYRFKVENTGVAKKAERGMKAATGAQKGQESKAKVVDLRRQEVRRLRDEYLAKPGNSKRSTDHAIAAALFPLLGRHGDDAGLVAEGPWSERTIRDDLAFLRAHSI